MNINTCVFSGNIVADTEVREVGHQHTPKCEFTIAVNRRVKKDGVWSDKPVFIECVAWGKDAENIAKFTSKGSPIVITGEMDQERWEDKKTGAKRSKLVLIVDRPVFMSGATRSDASSAKPPVANPKTADPMPSDTDDDDVPF